MVEYFLMKRISDPLDINQMRTMLSNNKIAIMQGEVIITTSEYQDLIDKTKERVKNHLMMVTKRW